MPSNFFRCMFTCFMAVAPAVAQLQPAPVLILIGPPGSGKSVQASYLSREYKVPSISMETLLKQSVGKKTELAKSLAALIASGELLDDNSANELVKARILRADASRGFILDGYPITPGQAKALDEFLAANNFAKPVVAIIDAGDDVVRERMRLRRRADDTSQNIERRIREYRALGAFTEKWYGSERVVRVDGTGTIQQVALALAQQIEKARLRRKLLISPPQGAELRQR